MRGDFLQAYVSSSYWLVSGKYAQSIMEALNSDVLSIEAKATEYKGGIRPAQSYEKIGNVAVISVNGAMDTAMSPITAQCGNFANYAAINELVTKAQQDKAVDIVLFRISSVGGNVNGAEVTSNKIIELSKHERTITLYEDIGASAAMLVFAGTNERYATSTTTRLGSIGVRTMMPNQDGKMEVIVSSNAPNKACTGSDCRAKIQAEIDEIETFFVDRMTQYTGWSAEQVISNFDRGGTISATKALELGFIRGIQDYDTMLASLISTERKNGMDENSLVTKLTDMSAENATLNLRVETLTAQNEALQGQIKAGQDAIDLAMGMNATPKAIAASAKLALGGATDKDAITAMITAMQSNGATLQGGESGSQAEPTKFKVNYEEVAKGMGIDVSNIR